MSASRLLVAALLTVGTAWESEAQRLAPLAPVTASTPVETYFASPVVLARMDVPPSMRAAARDTLPSPPELSLAGTVLGGIGGAVVGAVVGLGIGAEAARGCHGEFCELGPAVLGFALGESLGIGLGTHLGSRSAKHDHILLTTLSSMVILVSGALIASSTPQGDVMLPLTPILQIGAAWAIESGNR